MTLIKKFCQSPIHLQTLLAEHGYIASERIATLVFLALQLEKPLLIEGPAGVGKTELAKCLAKALGLEMIRLQCYEGLDESKALYEWEYSKQLLYIQILKDKIAQSFEQTQTIAEAVSQLSRQEDAFFSAQFLLARPLMKAIQSENPCVLMIDEVDKSDPEFEAFLLEFLADYAVTIPEIGTFVAKHPPIVMLTSNDQRDLSDALKRRCLHLFIAYPTLAVERQIVALKIPAVAENLLQQALEFVHRIRGLDLKKSPSISESIDWIKSLLTLQMNEWNEDTIRLTLSTLLKYQSDVDYVQKSLLH